MAANSLCHNSSIPNARDIDLVLYALGKEVQPDVAFEMIMTLAAYAQKEKTALPHLRSMLLSPKTPRFLAQRIALELPGEDVRYRLFKDLEQVEGKRSADVRRWIRARKFTDL